MLVKVNIQILSNEQGWLWEMIVEWMKLIVRIIFSSLIFTRRKKNGENFFFPKEHYNPTVKIENDWFYSFSILRTTWDLLYFYKMLNASYDAFLKIRSQRWRLKNWLSILSVKKKKKKISLFEATRKE